MRLSVEAVVESLKLTGKKGARDLQNRFKVKRS